MNDQPGPWGAAPPAPRPAPASPPGAQSVQFEWDPSLVEEGAARLAFVNRRREFFRLCLRGAALQFVTFGFYRFWLTTDVRRHLWSHTSLDGDALEYTGRALELLIGFLIALAILAPVYVVYFLIGIEAERLRAFASLPLFFFLYLFGHFALYRARRYRLSRTVWRGVRFWMDGSGLAYSARVFLWLVASVLTLGVVWPWRVASLERYKMRHSYYGDQRGDFVGRGGALMKRVWWIGLIALFGVIGFAMVSQSAVRVGLAAGRSPVLGNVGGALMALSMLALPFIVPVYRAVEWRWWADGVRFGEARGACSLSYGALIGLYVKALFVGIGVIVGLGLLVGAVGGGLFVALAQLGLPLDTQAAARGEGPLPYVISALFVAVYLLFGLAVGVVQRIYLQHDYWRMIATSITVHDVAALDAVAQRGDAANALGEGLADGLDVGGL